MGQCHRYQEYEMLPRYWKGRVERIRVVMPAPEAPTTSRAIVAPLKLVERIGKHKEFRESVKTVKGKEHQLDRLFHLWEMWKATQSTDLGIKATVWQFTLAFPADAFPDGLIDWMS